MPQRGTVVAWDEGRGIGEVRAARPYELRMPDPPGWIGTGTRICSDPLTVSRRNLAQARHLAAGAAVSFIPARGWRGPVATDVRELVTLDWALRRLRALWRRWRGQL